MARSQYRSGGGGIAAAGGGGSTSADLELGGSDELDGTKLSATMNTLTDEASVTPDCNADGLVWVLTLGGNRALVTPANADAGMTFVLKVIQGAAAYTLAQPASFKWPNGVAPVISVGSGDVDIITGVFDGTNWYCSFIQDMG